MSPTSQAAQPFTGAEIRQTFVDFFIQKHQHTFVASSSLVPGGDQTLLFTNAGMVQFKDVFLGTDKRPYTRAVNSQKCMRVAGKHNDLDDVGRDDTHHTFFEMLGNWSFGDYYKKDAVLWAWELLTEVWKLPKERLWTTCFQDDKGNIASDDEAAQAWRRQPGFDPAHVLFFGRKDNFWEMAETGPCGPCSEIHYDRGEAACNKQNIPGHQCKVNGDCTRFLELWNLVFIQYNRLGPASLEPLPATHVDTGMGLERIVSVLQEKNSNYRSDLLFPLIQAAQQLTGQTDAQRDADFTPYRVIADHARAAAFLIADGVVPGNTGRNYVCRMIIRRAARFGSKIGLHEPFLAVIADVVISNYGSFYPELIRNRAAILDSLTREEIRFQRTVEGGIAKLDQMLVELRLATGKVLSGEKAFDLYATYGLPLEITRDIAREQNLDVDEAGFHAAMDEHRITSGAGETFGELGGEDVDIYRSIVADLEASGALSPAGVGFDPYNALEMSGQVLALIASGKSVQRAAPGDRVEVILPQTSFYIESGGQVSDQGTIVSTSLPGWEVRVVDMRKPAAGVIVHVGEVVQGHPQVGDLAIGRVNALRRRDIMRNHTATHLLHAELRSVLGEHARQAGSLVAPDRLRFDFTHPEAVTTEQLERIEAGINRNILGDYTLKILQKPLKQAIAEGAMALFGEKYAENVRTISIGSEQPFSYELCGGTHVSETGDIGLCLITSEGSVASGIRRIEAVTGRAAYELVQRRFQLLKETAASLTVSPEEVPQKTQALLEELSSTRKQMATLRRENSLVQFTKLLENVSLVANVPVMAVEIPGADPDALRQMADSFRQRYPSGIVVLASVIEDRPMLIAAVTEDLVKRGVNAGELVKFVASPLGGSGGGRPTLAQAGGKDASQLPQVLAGVVGWVEAKLNPQPRYH
jgi:alanyl-tRNA synthetase